MRAMKYSGVEWLGEIPTDWDLKKVSYVSSRSRISATDLEVVTAFRDGQVTLRANRRLDGFTEATQYHGYQRIKPGQVAVHRMDAFAGAIGVSDSDGMCSPVLTLLDCEPILNPRFLAIYLREISKSGWIEALAKSVRERTSEFGWSELAGQAVVVPTLEEQNEIVSYLDEETSQIDLLIKKKEQLIEKLLERRQALITHAVTKGLDPNVPMKDSGVDWIGPYPSHWSIEKLSTLCEIRSGYSFNSELFELDGDIPVIRMTDLTGDSSPVFVRGIFDGIPQSAWVEKGDIVLGMTGDYRAIVWSKSRSLLNQRLASLRFGDLSFAEYVIFALQIALQQANANSLSTTIKNLSLSELRSIRLPIPPSKEITELHSAVNSEVVQLDSLVEKARLTISLMAERRQALITQVVTGKLDVRGFAGGNS